MGLGLGKEGEIDLMNKVSAIYVQEYICQYRDPRPEIRIRIRIGIIDADADADSDADQVQDQDIELLR